MKNPIHACRLVLLCCLLAISAPAVLTAQQRPSSVAVQPPTSCLQASVTGSERAEAMAEYAAREAAAPDLAAFAGGDGGVVGGVLLGVLIVILVVILV